ncbi:hypothetical protein PIIN_09265 [Serendipita indica DSM 11827]|uniref:Uncharacterized protein n=1 Tax=Serendipita indica (strain DSM 11827) TaxID=1109443 RepID=G4TVD8_SERID|nr:hypothetical protein PIIN_09265 [Serendipita indica DSM 11827]
MSFDDCIPVRAGPESKAPEDANEEKQADWINGYERRNTSHDKLTLMERQQTPYSAEYTSRALEETKSTASKRMNLVLDSADSPPQSEGSSDPAQTEKEEDDRSVSTDEGARLDIESEHSAALQAKLTIVDSPLTLESEDIIRIMQVLSPDDQDLVRDILAAPWFQSQQKEQVLDKYKERLRNMPSSETSISLFALFIILGKKNRCKICEALGEPWQGDSSLPRTFGHIRRHFNWHPDGRFSNETTKREFGRIRKLNAQGLKCDVWCRTPLHSAEQDAPYETPYEIYDEGPIIQLR